MLRLTSRARRALAPSFVCPSCRIRLLNRLTSPSSPVAFSTTTAACHENAPEPETEQTAEISKRVDKLSARKTKLLESTLEVLRSIQAQEASARNIPDADADAVPPRIDGLKSEETSRLLRSALTVLDKIVVSEQAAPSRVETDSNASSNDSAPGEASTGPDKNREQDGGRKRKKKRGEDHHRSALKRMKVRLFNPQSIDLTPVAVPTPPVPRLSYDLDRVLFNPSVYQLQDPRTLVYNFDPYLAQIMPVNEFDFDALKEYVTSSKDTTLIAAARQYGQKYAGSTSSMTSMLAHFHFLLSQWRPINCAALSRDFKVESTSFNRFLRAPAATFLHYNDGVYAIDADKEFDTANVLSMLGKSMEKLLTLPKEHFMKYHKTHSDKLPDNIRNAPESYHFSTMENFLMRSQLDAYDPRLPGTGMFDLKTRAVVTVRMDAAGYQKGSDYEIRSIRGQWQSFEREYYDMIRAAFLKYSLQVRMGRMDGIFTAYHNTRRIFGFQYIPLSEMDQAIHGTSSLKLGDTEFKASMHLLRKALDQITKRFPKKSIRLHVETRPTNPPCMYIFAKPVTADEISEVQLEAQRRVKEVERQILGMKEMAGADTNTTQTPDGSEGEEASPANATPGEDPEELSDADAWEAMMDTLETSLESEEEVSTAVRDSLEDALRASGLLKSMTAEKVESYLDTLEDILTGGDTHAAGPEPAAVPAAPEDAEPAPSEPVPQETATSAAEETDGGSSGVSNEPSLRDLILRAVERAKSIPSEASSPPLPAGETDPSSIQKAQKFETILLELAAQAKEQGENAPEAASTQSQTSNNDPSEGKAEQPAQTTDTVGEHTHEGTKSKKHASTKGAQKEEADPLLGLILTIRNKVNGEYVARPRGLSQTEEWEIEYAFSELPRDRARRIYDQLRRRRETSFRSDEDRSVQWYYSWQGALPKYASEGKQYRADLRGLVDTKQPVHVVGEGGGMFTWESVFGTGDGDGHGHDKKGKYEKYGEGWEGEGREGWAEKLRRWHVGDGGGR